MVAVRPAIDIVNADGFQSTGLSAARELMVVDM